MSRVRVPPSLLQASVDQVAGLSRDLADAAVAGYERTKALPDAERELLPVAFDLAGMVDPAAFIMWAAPAIGLTHVHECESWIAYLRNVDALS